MEIIEFNVWSSFLGGCLIGLSAFLFMFISGRVAGCSGILTNAILGVSGQRMWRVMFIVGLVIAPLLTSSSEYTLPEQYNFDWTILIIAGLLVGIGASMANGCTSGHGICGLGRLSKRSIIATCVFMSSAVITVYISRHMLGGL